MKEIKAVVRASKFYDVKGALDKLGIKGMTVYEVKGVGQQRGNIVSKGRPGSFRAADLIPKSKIEIVCDDSDKEKIISTIIESAKTGEVGDGKIFVSDISEVIRIRTEEKGTDGL